MTALSLLHSGAPATELDTKLLPADTQWVIHVDVEAARNTHIGKHFGERMLGSDWAKARIRRIKQEIGMDPVRDVLSVTAYDSRFVENSGVVMIHARQLDAERLIARLRQHRPDHRVVRHRSHTLYTWTNNEGDAQEHDVTGSIYGNVLVLSRDEAQVHRALDQLDGEGTDISQESPLAAQMDRGTVILARAVDMDAKTTPFRSQVIREAHAISLSAGQNGDQLFVSGMMVAGSAEVAQQCKSIVEGFRGMAALHTAQDPDAQRLLKGLSVKTTDCTILADWRASSEQITRLLERQLQKRLRPSNNGGGGANKNGDPQTPDPKSPPAEGATGTPHLEKVV